MVKEEKQKEKKIREEKIKNESKKCEDVRCPFHGKIRVHGRTFKGNIKKILGKRAIIEFERLIYIKKYDRYMKKKTRLHAYIPDCIEVNINDLVQVRECRPLSKIIHFIILKNYELKNK
jgi:small subunit ribosomal protein S17